MSLAVNVTESLQFTKVKVDPSYILVFFPENNKETTRTF